MNEQTNSLRDLFDESVRYWERMRFVYNAILTMLVIVCWGPDLLKTIPPTIFAWLGVALLLIFFASIANTLYCAAYPVDIVLQLTPFRNEWLRFRWLLFSLGTCLASMLALYVMLGDLMP